MNYKRIRTILAIILFALLVGWMGVIFHFSAQDGTKSSEISSNLATDISEIVAPSRPTEETAKIVEQNQKPVRKAAHFITYMILGTLSVSFFSTVYETNNKNKLIVSSSFCSFYAATDELHQYFVSGRSGLVVDIFLDSIGALVGIVLLLKALKYYVNIHRKKRCNSQKST